MPAFLALNDILEHVTLQANGNTQLVLEGLLGVCFITVLVVGLVWGSQTLKARWLHPLLLIAPFAVLYWVSRKQLRERFLKFYLPAVLVFSLLVLVGRVWQLSLTPYFGKGSRVTIPIQECVSHITNQSLDSYSEICASDNFLAAHLRVNNPNTIVRVGDYCGKEDLLRKLYWMKNEKNKPSGMVQLCQAQKGNHSVSVFHF